jgi:cation:H+ antiporter
VSSLLGLVLLVGGLALVVAGAELFVDGLLPTAARLRISPYVLSVVVSGFELENLAAGIALNVRGLGSGAAGTFLGGTTFLALAVPGLAALVAPLRVRIPLATLAWTAAAPLPLLALAADGNLTRLEGGILVAWFPVALVGLVRSGRDLVGELPVERRRFPLVRLLVGLGVLTGGGEALGAGIHGVVTRLGVSQSLLGNTAIAASIEAEELGRVFAPARRGRGDVALGNIFGTIVHFVAFNAGVIALVRPLTLDADSRHLHLPFAVSGPVLLALLAARGGLGRPAGAVLVTLYVGYVAAAVALAVT